MSDSVLVDERAAAVRERLRVLSEALAAALDTLDAVEIAIATERKEQKERLASARDAVTAIRKRMKEVRAGQLELLPSTEGGES